MTDFYSFCSFSFFFMSPCPLPLSRIRKALHYKLSESTPWKANTQTTVLHAGCNSKVIKYDFFVHSACK